MIISSIFFKIFLGQLVVGALVVFWLKRVLDGQLINLAVRCLDCWKPSEHAETAQSVVLITHRPLKQVLADKVRRLSSRRISSNIPVTFVVDKKIKGGVILKIGELEYDYSLKSRLREALRAA